MRVYVYIFYSSNRNKSSFIVNLIELFFMKMQFSKRQSFTSLGTVNERSREKNVSNYCYTHKVAHTHTHLGMVLMCCKYESGCLLIY